MSGKVFTWGRDGLLALILGASLAGCVKPQTLPGRVTESVIPPVPANADSKALKKAISDREDVITQLEGEVASLEARLDKTEDKETAARIRWAGVAFLALGVLLIVLGFWLPAGKKTCFIGAISCLGVGASCWFLAKLVPWLPVIGLCLAVVLGVVIAYYLREYLKGLTEGFKISATLNQLSGFAEGELDKLLARAKTLNLDDFKKLREKIAGIRSVPPAPSG